MSTEAPPPDHPGDERRDELYAAPPFASWRAIYAVVLAALAAQVALYAALTAFYKR